MLYLIYLIYYWLLSRENYNKKSSEIISIGDLNYASYYIIDFSIINKKKIILCTLFSNNKKYQQLKNISKLSIDEIPYEALYDNKIDNTNNSKFKEILILLILYIDWYLEKNPIKGGSSIKNSYQLYINDKNLI